MKRDERARRRGDAYTVASSEANRPPTRVELDKDLVQRRRSSKRHCHERWLSVVGSRHGRISSPWACWPSRVPVMWARRLGARQPRVHASHHGCRSRGRASS
jgi:hypothetical protein